MIQKKVHRESLSFATEEFSNFKKNSMMTPFSLKIETVEF